MTKSAIVIGGSAGVGRAVVQTLRDRGYAVAVVARGKERLAQMHAADPLITTASADVGDAKALSTVVTDLMTGLPSKPTVWINCAMATSFSPFQDMDIDEFDKIIRTTFLGQVNGTRLALEYMDHGNIVNVGSGLSYRPVPGQSAYCAAKHAINGFTGSLRSEILKEGRDIEISLVQLPAINTPQFDWARSRLDRMPQPAPPIFAPQVAADGIMKAIDENLREVFIGQSVLKLVAGDMILPAFIDRKLSREGVEMQKSDQPDPGGRPDNLFEPVDHPAQAEGSYSNRASDKGVSMDADLVRKIAVFGGALVIFLAGVIIG